MKRYMQQIRLPAARPAPGITRVRCGAEQFGWNRAVVGMCAFHTGFDSGLKGT